MGNFIVFAADMPAGPASFQKPLFIGTLSLFDWFEIISCKAQNYLFILFNGPCCNDNVFSPTINDRNQHAIQLSCFYFLTFILTSQNSLEHSAVLKKRAY